jgi:hypothetical protein
MSLSRLSSVVIVALSVAGCASTPPAGAPPVTNVDVGQGLAPVPTIFPRGQEPVVVAAPRKVAEARDGYAFEGTWKASDGSIWRLTHDQFYLRFDHNGALRENFGRILEVDEASGHFVIEYVRSVENGVEVPVPGQRGHVRHRGRWHPQVGPELAPVPRGERRDLHACSRLRFSSIATQYRCRRRCPCSGRTRRCPRG